MSKIATNPYFSCLCILQKIIKTHKRNLTNKFDLVILYSVNSNRSSQFNVSSTNVNILPFKIKDIKNRTTIPSNKLNIYATTLITKGKIQ